MGAVAGKLGSVGGLIGKKDTKNLFDVAGVYGNMFKEPPKDLTPPPPKPLKTDTELAADYEDDQVRRRSALGASQVLTSPNDAPLSASRRYLGQ